MSEKRYRYIGPTRRPSVSRRIEYVIKAITSFRGRQWVLLAWLPCDGRGEKPQARWVAWKDFQDNYEDVSHE